MKPLAIIVSGAPGSGKSTCAAKLAAYMRLPHIERDSITRGLERTRGARVKPATESLPLYFTHMAGLLKDGISLVTDGTLYKGISEADVKSFIISNAFTINVHVRAQNEHERFYSREMSREGHPNDWVEGHMKVLDEIYDKVVDPLGLGIPVIEVDATDGYDPSIVEIVGKINALFESGRKITEKEGTRETVEEN